MNDNMDMLYDDYENMFELENSPDDAFYEPEIKTRPCGICGTKNLHWEMTQGKWRLFDKNNNRHFCSERIKQKQLKEDEDRNRKSEPVPF